MSGNAIDVVEFEIGGELYAMDIQLAREIVEMVPLTPLPRAPEYISGIINLRGEITTILSIDDLIGIKGKKAGGIQKIIILVPGAAGGSNVGIIVDDVHSVIQVDEQSVEKIDGGFSAGAGNYVKGIIKSGLEDTDNKGLIIWLDLEKLLRDLVDLEKK
jgi:purine-binding chemotaxis protein CheW